MSLVDDDRFTLPENNLTGNDQADNGAPADDAAETAAEVTFADLGLHHDVVRALAERGVTVPFPIQAATIPDALAGKDVLGRGRTGSGKTLSFGLPLLTRLSEGGRTKAKHPRGLILTPTRELAMQVSDALEPYGRVLGLELKVVCGGTSMPRQIYALERGVDVLVATPGRLRDLVERGACVLDEVQIAVLDEADQMADMGFLPEVTEILDLVPPGGQRMLFSATLENEIDTLVKRYLDNPVTHEVDPSAGAVTTMTHHILVVKPKDKAPVTNAIAARKGRTIVFVRTQMGADRVAEQLRAAGVRADALHGGMTQGARTRTLGDFKDGYVSVLVATDVAARGIHVDGIDLVLNVDPAADHKDYLHRSGRTARAGRSGTVVTLVLPHQRRGAFRLMEDAGVEASRHIVGGAFDAELVQITGARSLTEVQAESAATAAKQAEREVTDLTRELEKAQRRATELREDAERLSARAARERAQLGIDEPVSGTSEDAPAASEVLPEQAPVTAEQPAEEQAAAPAYEAAPRRRDDRERPRSYDRRDDRDRPRSFERRDDRDRPRSYDRRDDRDRPRSFERRDDRDRPRSYERRDDRPAAGRSYDRPYGGDRERGARPAFGDRDRNSRPYGRRDDHRPYGDRERGSAERGDRPARPYERRNDRGFGGGPRGAADRKPGWRRNG
jgi:superfamily II DNA/RNA helicase